MSWLVDAHVHYHPVFGWDAFFEGVVANTARAARTRPAGDPITATCLLFADPQGTTTVETLFSHAADALPSWRLRPADAGGAVLSPPGGAPRIVLLAGRQIRARQRLELLALDCTESIPDGLPLEETVRRAADAGAISVIPWGFGKWWGSRGRTVAEVLQRRGTNGLRNLHVGDNGNRLTIGSDPSIFAKARAAGALNLPGSDPLPFRDHARRAGSYGFLLPGEPDLDHPGASLREALEALRSDPLPVGSRRSPAAFVADQIRMQLPGAGR